MLKDCRVLQFEPPTPERSLAGHVIKSFWVKSGESCEANCFEDDDCMSINFGPKTQGKHLCDLSSSDHNLHPDDLKERPKFIYKSVLVSENIDTVKRKTSEYYSQLSLKQHRWGWASKRVEFKKKSSSVVGGGDDRHILQHLES